MSGHEPRVHLIAAHSEITAALAATRSAGRTRLALGGQFGLCTAYQYWQVAREQYAQTGDAAALDRMLFYVTEDWREPPADEIWMKTEPVPARKVRQERSFGRRLTLLALWIAAAWLVAMAVSLVFTGAPW